MTTEIKLRADIAADWTSVNPTLAHGEWGLEIDTRKIKIGDGSTAWNSLGYFKNNRTIGCRLLDTTPQTITSSWNTLNFGAESPWWGFDSDGMHDNVTNPSRITINRAGKYLIGGVIYIVSNVVSGARIVLNGSTVLARQRQGNSGDPEGVRVMTIYNCAVSDYLTLQGYASSNAGVQGDARTNFWAIFIG